MDNKRKNEETKEDPKPFTQSGLLTGPLRGLRNGLYYGGKVRFTHGLVMMLLFRKSDWKTSIKNVAKNSWEHGRNLGFYVFLYKLIVGLLERLRKKKSKLHNFLAGVIAGSIAFRENTSVNYQITLYLLSRVVVGGITNIAKKKNKLPDFDTHPYLAAACWAIVMFLFEDDPGSLQVSLKSSMDYLYKESESYTSWVDFVPFIIPQSVAKLVNEALGKK